MKPDLLNEEFISSLSQPLWIRQWGDKEFMWPVYDICVQTGLLRIDVCGKLQAMHFSDISEIKDDGGNIYDAEEFYLEKE